MKFLSTCGETEVTNEDVEANFSPHIKPWNNEELSKEYPNGLLL